MKYIFQTYYSGIIMLSTLIQVTQKLLDKISIFILRNFKKNYPLNNLQYNRVDLV